jgi:lipid-binding SYLF domain-containing protein
MRKLVSLVVLVGLCATYGLAQKPEEKGKELERVQSATKVLNEIMAAPDKGIPEEILAGADCVIVVPSMIKGAIGFGGRYGKGVATCRTASSGANRWSAPAPVRIEGGSWGLQLGGQAIDLVMLAMNDQGVQHLLKSKFKVGADASAAAGPVGRHTEAGTDWKMKAQLLSYSRARGLFAGIDINGTVVKQDTDDTLALYGKYVPFDQILTGKVAAPTGTQQFLANVRKYFGEAKASKTENAQAASPSRSTRAQASGGTAGTAGTGAAGETTGAQAGSVAAPPQSSTSQSTTTTETTEQAAGSSTSSDQVRSNIENALRGTPNLSTNNIAVSVTNDQVMLAGSVPNQSDKAAARRIAEQNANGRKVVDNDLVVK